MGSGPLTGTPRPCLGDQVAISGVAATGWRIRPPGLTSPRSGAATTYTRAAPSIRTPHVCHTSNGTLGSSPLRQLPCLASMVTPLPSPQCQDHDVKQPALPLCGEGETLGAQSLGSIPSSSTRRAADIRLRPGCRHGRAACSNLAGEISCTAASWTKETSWRIRARWNTGRRRQERWCALAGTYLSQPVCGGAAASHEHV